MKTVLFGEKKNMYKANLHCHTTYSDGKLTPEQVKEEYSKRGYSVVAFTEHEYIANHSWLTDDKFLALTGYEVSFDRRRPGGSDDFKFVINYHINLYQKKPGNYKHVCWNPKNCWCGDKAQIENAEYVGDVFGKECTPKCVNNVIKTAHENGFLVSLNHPRWSMLSYPDYIPLEGLDFLEIYNSGCMVEGNEDYVPHMMDEFLRAGKQVKCTATDDNHNYVPLDDLHNDSFGGWVTINADALEYEVITDALEKGAFYASTGVEIKQIAMEDGKITVDSSPAKYIIFTTGTRRSARIVKTPGEELTHGEYHVDPDDDYVRITIVDEQGGTANSQAYDAKMFKI